MGIQQRSILLRLSYLDMTRAQLAEISGVREQQLIPWLRGTKPLPGPDVEQITRTLIDCEILLDKFRPAPLSFADTRKVKFLVQQLRDDNLRDFPSPRALELVDEMEAVLGREYAAR